jgi:hypothetical protein
VEEKKIIPAAKGVLQIPQKKDKLAAGYSIFFIYIYIEENLEVGEKRKVV